MRWLPGIQLECQGSHREPTCRLKQVGVAMPGCMASTITIVGALSLAGVVVHHGCASRLCITVEGRIICWKAATGG